MAEPLRIALAGLGTVGTGVIELLAANRSTIERRAGRPLEIVAVNARDRARDRGVDLSPYAWVDDMQAMAQRGDVGIRFGRGIDEIFGEGTDDAVTTGVDLADALWVFTCCLDQAAGRSVNDRGNPARLGVKRVSSLHSHFTVSGKKVRSVGLTVSFFKKLGVFKRFNSRRS